MKPSLKVTPTAGPLSLKLHKQEVIKKQSSIIASCIVSESELQLQSPLFKAEDSVDTNGNLEEWFLDVLCEMGMDTRQSIKFDLSITHRNKLNKVVTCGRWLGEERTDPAWLNSGYASRAAKDKAGGSFLVEESYRQRGETKEIQEMYATKDKCSIIDESVWVD